jgi:hypothetical protein
VQPPVVAFIRLLGPHLSAARSAVSWVLMEATPSRGNTVEVLVAGAEPQGGEAPRDDGVHSGATERLGATTVTSWSGQTRGGWSITPSAGILRFVDEDVGFFVKTGGGWAMVPTQGLLGGKKKLGMVSELYSSLLLDLIRSNLYKNWAYIYIRPAEGRGAKDGS